MAKDLLLLSMKKFVESRLTPGKPLLLGCSGGPDSKALLYLLIKCKRFIPFDLHVAHIDHGWREESADNAVALAKKPKAFSWGIGRNKGGITVLNSSVIFTKL